MHGLVTGEDPRQRRGDCPVENHAESQRLVDTNDALLQLLAAGGIGLFSLPVGICPHFSKRSSPTGAGFAGAERSWVDKDPRLCYVFRVFAYSSASHPPLGCVNRWRWPHRFMHVMVSA